MIDQGIGIPEPELDKVFERFQRGGNAPEKTGSGLGLSVVKLLVEGMGGSIEVLPPRRRQLFHRDPPSVPTGCSC